MEKLEVNWENLQSQHGLSYVCGFCGSHTAPSSGWNSAKNPALQRGYVLICSFCNRPSFVLTENEKIVLTVPGVKFGDSISRLPDEINSLYQEARLCSSVGAFTSSVLTCRKILMHIAVENGADKKGNFFILWLPILLKMVISLLMVMLGLTIFEKNQTRQTMKLFL